MSPIQERPQETDWLAHYRERLDEIRNRREDVESRETPDPSPTQDWLSYYKGQLDSTRSARQLQSAAEAAPKGYQSVIPSSYTEDPRVQLGDPDKYTGSRAKTQLPWGQEIARAFGRAARTTWPSAIGGFMQTIGTSGAARRDESAARYRAMAASELEKDPDKDISFYEQMAQQAEQPGFGNEWLYETGGKFAEKGFFPGGGEEFAEKYPPSEYFPPGVIEQVTGRPFPSGKEIVSGLPEGLSSAAPSFAQALLYRKLDPKLVKKIPKLARFLGYATPTLTLEAGHAYRGAIQRHLDGGMGLSDAQGMAAREALMTGTINSGIEFMGFMRFVERVAPQFEKTIRNTIGRHLTNVLTGAATEATEEVLQELVSSYVGSEIGNNLQAWDDIESRLYLGGAIGGIIGGGMGLATPTTTDTGDPLAPLGGAERTTTPLPPTVIPGAEDETVESAPEEEVLPEGTVIPAPEEDTRSPARRRADIRLERRDREARKEAREKAERESEAPDIDLVHIGEEGVTTTPLEADLEEETLTPSEEVPTFTTETLQPEVHPSRLPRLRAQVEEAEEELEEAKALLEAHPKEDVVGAAEGSAKETEGVLKDLVEEYEKTLEERTSTLRTAEAKAVGLAESEARERADVTEVAEVAPEVEEPTISERASQFAEQWKSELGVGVVPGEFIDEPPLQEFVEKVGVKNVPLPSDIKETITTRIEQADKYTDIAVIEHQFERYREAFGDELADAYAAEIDLEGSLKKISDSVEGPVEKPVEKPPTKLEGDAAAVADRLWGPTEEEETTDVFPELTTVPEDVFMKDRIEGPSFLEDLRADKGTADPVVRVEERERTTRVLAQSSYPAGGSATPEGSVTADVSATELRGKWRFEIDSYGTKSPHPVGYTWDVEVVLTNDDFHLDVSDLTDEIDALALEYLPYLETGRWVTVSDRWGPAPDKKDEYRIDIDYRWKEPKRGSYDLKNQYLWDTVPSEEKIKRDRYGRTIVGHPSELKHVVGDEVTFTKDPDRLTEYSGLLGPSEEPAPKITGEVESGWIEEDGHDVQKFYNVVEKTEDNPEGTLHVAREEQIYTPPSETEVEDVEAEVIETELLEAPDDVGTDLEEGLTEEVPGEVSGAEEERDVGEPSPEGGEPSPRGERQYSPADITEEPVAEDDRLLGEGTAVEPTEEPGRRDSLTTRAATGSDFHILDEYGIGEGGDLVRARQNIAAIELLFELEAEDRLPNPEEQLVLAKYSGWGSTELSKVFNTWRISRGGLEEVRLRLIELFADDEDTFNRMRRGVQYQHFTSIPVIKAIYTAIDRLGIKGGNFLEPAGGIGTFLGLTPDGMNAKWTAIEIDGLLARMLSKLYPKQSIVHSGLQDAAGVPQDRYDLVISNVPFANIKVHDETWRGSEKKALKARLHDYFFAKSLEKLRPGGVVAFITSTGTMDKKNSTVREYLRRQAYFLGAVRLPQNTFQEVAGTAVSTDIIFLQKREKPLQLGWDRGLSKSEAAQVEGSPIQYEGFAQPITEGSFGTQWMNTIEREYEGVTSRINEYFIANPDVVIGWPFQLLSGRFGKTMGTVLEDMDELPLELQKALSTLPKDIFKPAEGINTDAVVTVSKKDEYKIGSLRVEGKDRRSSRIVMMTEAGPVDFTVPKNSLWRVIDLIELRDIVRNLLNLQLTEATTEEKEEARRDLNDAYGSFVGHYGRINKAIRNKPRIKKDAEGVEREVITYRYPNLRYFSKDPESPLVTALEDYDLKTGLAEKTAIFDRDIITKPEILESTSDPQEALLATLGEVGILDLDLVAKKLDVTADVVPGMLGESTYFNPALGRWEIAERYLSGNVRIKLKQARAAVVSDPELKRNIEALKKVIPTELTIDEIAANPGSAWIPAAVYRTFFKEIVGLNAIIEYNELSYTWFVRPKRNGDIHTYEAVDDWGTSDIHAFQLFKRILNNGKIEVRRSIPNSTRTTPDLPATEAALAKADDIRAAFKEFVQVKEGKIKLDRTRSVDLVKLYNDQFNAHALPDYDGSYLSFPGMNSTITLRPHQTSFVSRFIQEGNTLAAHVVGSGKTYSMVAAAMEAKRLGLVSKPMVTVPDHMVAQFISEAQKLYPNGRFLMARTEDIGNLDKFASSVALGDWDLIVLSHTSFTRIPVSSKTQTIYIEEELQRWRSYLSRPGLDRASRKSIEAQIEAYEEKLSEALEAGKDKIKAVTFEDLGVDLVLVDEADLFKNLQFPTHLGRLGVTPGKYVKKSGDLHMKLSYLRGINPTHNAIFATGTPISNSLHEIWTVIRYLKPEVLVQKNVQYFDRFASTFAQITIRAEKTTAGDYQRKERLAQFSNVPELVRMFRQIADIQLDEDVDLPVPDMLGGEPEVIYLPASDYILAGMKTILRRSEVIKSGQVDPKDDNHLKLSTDARKLSLDERLWATKDQSEEEGEISERDRIDVSEIPDNPDSKANRAVDKIFEIWKSNEKYKGTQLVFIDFSKPRHDRFSVPVDMKNKLVKLGVPESEIAFINTPEYKKPEAKLRLFDQMNNGDVRILFGSTLTMGVGTNVQKLGVAMHLIDAPWRPRDMEQRIGRFIRQGNWLWDNNLISGIRVIYYAVERSFDEFMFETLRRKAAFIHQVMRGDPNIREMKDLGKSTMLHAEISAIASGDPLILERATLEADIARLEARKRSHQNRQGKARGFLRYNEANLRTDQKRLPLFEADAELIEDVSGDKFKITIRGEEIEGPGARAKAAEALMKIFPTEGFSDPDAFIVVGTFAGMELRLVGRVFSSHPYFLLTGNEKHSTEASLIASPEGLIQRLGNLAAKVRNKSVQLQKDIIENKENQLKAEQKILDAPFSAIEELEKNKARLEAIINQQLGQPPGQIETPTEIMVSAAEPEGGLDEVIKTFDLWHSGEVQDVEELVDPGGLVGLTLMTTRELEEGSEYEFKISEGLAPGEVTVEDREDFLMLSYDGGETGWLHPNIEKFQAKTVPGEEITDVFPELTDVYEGYYQRASEDMKTGIVPIPVRKDPDNIGYMTTKLYTFGLDAIFAGIKSALSSKESKAGLAIDSNGVVRTSRKADRLLKKVVSTEERAERLFQENKGLLPPSIRERVSEWLTTRKHMFTRHFLYLDPEVSVEAAVADKFRIYEASPQWASLQAISAILKTTGDLESDAELDLFTRLLILPDILKDIEAGLYDSKPVPFYGKDPEGNPRTTSESEEAIRRDASHFERSLNDPKKVPAAAAERIRTALKLRTQMNQDMKELLVAIGLLDDRVLEDDRYYHRQVMDKGLDSKLKKKRFLTGVGGDVRLKTKGFQMQRIGGSEFNTDYVQSEFEWLSDAFGLIARKRVLDDTELLASKTHEVRGMAKQHNIKAMEADFNAKHPDMGYPYYGEAEYMLLPFKRTLRWTNDELQKLAYEGQLPMGEFQGVVEELAQRHSMSLYEKEGLGGFSTAQYWWYLRWLASDKGTSREGRGGILARVILRALADKDAFIKHWAGDNYVDISSPQQLLKFARSINPEFEDYELWQPEKGHHFFNAMTTSEQILNEIAAGEREFSSDQFQRNLVVGSQKETWLVPAGVAAHLEQFRGEARHEFDIDIIFATGTWKEWTLLMPLKAIRYNINNLSGDLDISLAYDARITKYVMGAIKELRKKGDPEALAEAQRLGVIGSGFAIQEVEGVSSRGLFNAMFEGGQEIVEAKGKHGIFKRYWKSVIEFTAFRENILRLATYRYFQAELAKGKDMYGASRPSEVSAVKDPDERAAKLARELIGDYGNISYAGQFIRRRMIPFYSWIEINSPRYYRLLKNLKHEGRSGGITVPGYLTRRAAALGVGLALRSHLLFIFVTLWNKIYWPEEEEEMAKQFPGQKHIILGRNPDTGLIMSLRFEGALADALEWWDLADYPQDIEDFYNGDKSVRIIGEDAIKATTNRLVNSLVPWAKTGAELAAGVSFFPYVLDPDPGLEFSPRPLRDRWEHLSRLFSMQTAYKAITGKPIRTEGWGHLMNLIVYETDPDEAAFYNVRNRIDEYFDQLDQATKRTNSLWNWRKSNAWEGSDSEKTAKFLQDYYDYGGTDRGLSQAVARQNPFWGIDENERRDFMETQSPEQATEIDRAVEWYEGLYEDVLPRTRRRRAARPRRQRQSR